MPEKIAVLGASGFVGSTLVEYLQDETDYEVAPFAHSSGGATCLAHRGMVFQQVDILDRAALRQALDGYDYVVNCSRGGPEVMLDGMDNIIHAANKTSIKKLIHLSSVAVYGDPPPAESVSESAPTKPVANSYGAIKLLQDDKVQSAASKGLASVILCPPNIIGPYSDYVINVVNSIEAGRFRLIDDGQHVINVVDVTNLCAAMVAAIRSSVTDGRRFFVCEPEHLTWSQFCDFLKPVIRPSAPIASISSENFAASNGATDSTQPAPSNSALKHLVSDEVREVLRLNPRWAAVENTAKKTVRKLGSIVETYAHDVAVGPIKVDMARIDPAIDTALISQQLRKVRHDPSAAFHALEFQPLRSLEQSMSAFCAWYTEFFDADSAEWALLGEGLKR